MLGKEKKTVQLLFLFMNPFRFTWHPWRQVGMFDSKVDRIFIKSSNIT